MVMKVPQIIDLAEGQNGESLQRETKTAEAVGWRRSKVQTSDFGVIGSPNRGYGNALGSK